MPMVSVAPGVSVPHPVRFTRNNPKLRMPNAEIANFIKIPFLRLRCRECISARKFPPEEPLQDTHPATQIDLTHRFCVAYPFAVKAFTFWLCPCGDNSSGLSAANTDRDHKQPAQCGRASAEDVPGGIVGESAGEGVADLIRGR